MTAESQRSFWLFSYCFGDEGEKARLQSKRAAASNWELGVELNLDPVSDKAKLAKHTRGLNQDFPQSSWSGRRRLAMQVDPRTVARDIFGVVDELFPHLTPGAVNNFNSRIIEVDFGESPENFIASSKLQKALLFELAYSVAESLLSELPIDWDRCLLMAIDRQRSFFDAKVSRSLEDPDKTAALMVGTNLAHWLVLQSSANGNILTSGPFIPGLEWIASGREISASLKV